MNDKRIEWLDIAKGIGIFLVVYAHARAPYFSYIYNFHMPFFFLISGILYKTGGEPKTYILRKIKTLYIPFVGWNLIFIIGKGLIRHGALSFDSILKVVLTLEKDGEFLGATWFLGSLFVISIIFKILDYNLSESSEKKYILLGIFLIWGIIGIEITLPYMISRTLICGFFYAVGYFGKIFFTEFSLSKDMLVYAIVSGLSFLMIGHYNSANMGANEYRYKALFFIGAVLASFAVLFISKCLEKLNGRAGRCLRKAICYIGKNSIDIVIWQFVFFRIVIAVQLLLSNISLKKLWDYYPMYSEKNGWWLVYTAVGIIFPVLWGRFLRTGIWGRFLKKICLVN